MSLNAIQASSPEGTTISWLTTQELCSQLGISRSKLCRWQQRRVLRQSIHWVRKNPTTSKSSLLWNLATCRALLQPQRQL